MDLSGDLFGEKRLVEMLKNPAMTGAKTIVDETVRVVTDFKGDKQQEDDITVLALSFQGGDTRAPTATISERAKNELSEVGRINDVFEVFFEKHSVDFAVVMKIQLILDELLNNIISYAYADNSEHEIEVRAELAGNRLTVTITDDGIPFNPLNMKTPDLPSDSEDWSIGGLGIHLVRNLTDEISYQRRIEQNVLRLVKILD
jgi:sigma-B regulation protein RsbU (phosphoserine phosphatase)